MLGIHSVEKLLHSTNRGQKVQKEPLNVIEHHLKFVGYLQTFYNKDPVYFVLNLNCKMRLLMMYLCIYLNSWNGRFLSVAPLNIWLQRLWKAGSLDMTR